MIDFFQWKFQLRVQWLLKIYKLGIIKPWKIFALTEMSSDKMFSYHGNLDFMFKFQKNTAKNENKGESQYLLKK